MATGEGDTIISDLISRYMEELHSDVLEYYTT
jgi:hypothetical protein